MLVLPTDWSPRNTILTFVFPETVVVDMFILLDDLWNLSEIHIKSLLKSNQFVIILHYKLKQKSINQKNKSQMSKQRMLDMNEEVDDQTNRIRNMNRQAN